VVVVCGTEFGSEGVVRVELDSFLFLGYLYAIKVIQ